ncbi:metallophosphoesterase [Streptomyces sp. NBC_00536]|uniref:metallophosphoesterase n=1 Tax=Streptomyces sp. NBC_00536 TaxID=2975769 RepID=UPI002E80BA45|nr:metallophosphoesterase [Streptomyces sp. NBC_00536]WUC77218.1 metallophosphoesterase [Streptomyces sp. NBC_00536]
MPPAPGRIRLAHLADLHIGSPLRGLDDHPGAPAIDPEQAPYDALDALVGRVADGRYDGVLVAGDVFDRHHADAAALTAFQDVLGRFHDEGLVTVVVSGNHDAESPLPQKLHLPPSVRWLGAHAPETVHWEHLGTAVHGQSIAEADDLRDLAADYPRRIPGLANIGLLHTSLHGAWSRKTCAPTDVRTLATAGYDYWALGHVHHRLVPARGFLAVYPGNTHARGPAENGGRGYTELLIDGETLTASAVDTAPVRYESLVVARAATAEADIRARFAAVPPPAGSATAGAGRVVVWTLSGPGGEDLVRLAREVADELGRADFMVCRAPCAATVRAVSPPTAPEGPAG